MCKCHIWLSVLVLAIVGQKLVVDGVYDMHLPLLLYVHYVFQGLNSFINDIKFLLFYKIHVLKV